MPDQYVHHFMLCQICERAGPEPATAIRFEDVTCPTCSSSRRLHEAAMEQVMDELVIDMHRAGSSLPSDDPVRLHLRKLLEDAGHISPE